MRKLFLSMFLLCWSVLTVWATGTRESYGNNTAALQHTATQTSLSNAVQLADLRANLETAIEKTPKLAFSKRIALKSMLKKVKQAEQTNGDLSSLLVTLGIILLIVGVVILVLGIALSGGVYYGGGSGLIVLGLIFYLVGKYADL